MQPVHLFDLAAKQAEWLGVRQKVIAGNVANVNTPGFKARDIAPFASVLEAGSGLAMAQTNALHMDVSENRLETQIVNGEGAREVTHSGNNVVLEDEMMKGSQTAREMSLNTAIVKSFHHMMMSVVQGK